MHSAFICLPRSLTTDDTYNANSLVGTKINDYTWVFSTSNFSSIGITYAAVLPVPFLALAIMDLP